MTDPALFLSRYPALASLPAERLARDLSNVPLIQAPAKTVLFRETEPCPGFPFVLEGQIRVGRGSPDGRELELYRVQAGEICMVSAACLVAEVPMAARAACTVTSLLALVDRPTLVAWTEFEPIRLLVLGQLGARIAELAALVEAVAFQRLDQRLARALLGRGRTVHATHQQFADDLGTAREMVSRLLRRFEEQGFVRLGREQVSIVDPEALRSLSGGR